VLTHIPSFSEERKMILEEETFKKFGYYPRDLKPQSRRRILASCNDCGKVREIYQHAYHPLCGSCATKGKNNYNFGRTGDNSSRWAGGRIKCICKQCGVEFKVYPSNIKKGRGKFCSGVCQRRWISKHQNGENSPLWKPRLKRICKVCGKEFQASPSKVEKGGGKFCSIKCWGKWESEYRKGERNPAWRGGESFEPYCSKFNESFKEYIRDKFERICFLCSITEEENGQRLSVHHVNYDKACMCNDNVTCQFVPLCRSCNSKVNANRKVWEQKIKDKMRNKLNGWYI